MGAEIGLEVVLERLAPAIVNILPLHRLDVIVYAVRFLPLVLVD